jgi:hypothetical protein
MNGLVLQISRIVRIVSYDSTLPSICNAVYYEIKDTDVCDCKNICKFPPPKNNTLDVKNHLNNNVYGIVRSNGTPQLYSRH